MDASYQPFRLGPQRYAALMGKQIVHDHLPNPVLAATGLLLHRGVSNLNHMHGERGLGSPGASRHCTNQRRAEWEKVGGVKNPVNPAACPLRPLHANIRLCALPHKSLALDWDLQAPCIDGFVAATSPHVAQFNLSVSHPQIIRV